VDGSPAGSHPAFAAHPIQGWTPDFIPLVLEKGLDQTLHDEIVEIPDGASVAMAQSLARNEGILTGISGGATMWAAIETAKKAPEGSVLVAMLPDTGERYLSTPLFASIDADMNEEELAIARSTPSHILEPPSVASASLEDQVDLGPGPIAAASQNFDSEKDTVEILRGAMSRSAARFVRPCDGWGSKDSASRSCPTPSAWLE